MPAPTTSAYQIGISWDQGAYDGSSPVVDYQVSIKEEQNTYFSIAQSGIPVTQEDFTITGLTPGQSYTIVVQARNVVNFSAYSAEITILAAQVPDEPTNLVNVPSQTSAV